LDRRRQTSAAEIDFARPLQHQIAAGWPGRCFPGTRTGHQHESGRIAERVVEEGA
jgi:hypothetical protein